ncbi:MAG: hypothetical protein N2440_05485 [Actinobacteria bacterium]|nr:hypothetical protein [Actinomycetota bacterium]
MTQEEKLSELLKNLKNNLKIVRDPNVDLSKAIQILEESTESFRELIDELEVESPGKGTYKDS